MMLIAAKIDGFTIYHIWWVTPSKFLKMFQEAFSFGTLLRTEGLFSVMDHQLSFGVELDVLVEELQYYFEQTQAAEHLEEAYRYVGRKPKRGLEQKNVKLEQVWMIEILGET